MTDKHWAASLINSFKFEIDNTLVSHIQTCKQCKKKIHKSTDKFGIELEKELEQSIGWSADTDTCFHCKSKEK